MTCVKLKPRQPRPRISFSLAYDKSVEQNCSVRCIFACSNIYIYICTSLSNHSGSRKCILFISDRYSASLLSRKFRLVLSPLTSSSVPNQAGRDWLICLISSNVSLGPGKIDRPMTAGL